MKATHSYVASAASGAASFAGVVGSPSFLDSYSCGSHNRLFVVIAIAATATAVVATICYSFDR